MTAARAISFKVCCDRIGLSYRTGERRLADGTFPVPELPRLGRNHRFSSLEIDRYLATASTADARLGFPRVRRKVAA